MRSRCLTDGIQLRHLKTQGPICSNKIGWFNDITSSPGSAQCGVRPSLMFKISMTEFEFEGFKLFMFDQHQFPGFRRSDKVKV